MAIKEIASVLIGISIVTAIVFGIVSITTQYECGYYFEECKMKSNTRVKVTVCSGGNGTQYCCDQDCWNYETSKPYCGDGCC